MVKNDTLYTRLCISSLLMATMLVLFVIFYWSVIS